MPLYEYACYECNKTTDLIRAISDRDKKANCPLCGASKTLKRVEIAGNCNVQPTEGYKFGVTLSNGRQVKDTKKKFNTKLGKK